MFVYHPNVTYYCREICIDFPKSDIPKPDETQAYFVALNSRLERDTHTAVNLPSGRLWHSSQNFLPRSAISEEHIRRRNLNR